MARQLGIMAILAVSALILAEPVAAKTFRWSFPGEIAGGMDPHAHSGPQNIGFIANMYEGLVRRNEKLEIEPSLAVKWESLSPTIWRFHLRKGVVFHDGADFTAEDVIFSIKRAQSEGSDLKYTAHSIIETKKVDDHTVDIVTANPNPIMTSELVDLLIMDKEWSEKNNAVEVAAVAKSAESYATRNANGTGPFALKIRQPDVRTVLVENKRWWDQRRHNVSEAIFTPISSNSTRVAALLSGEVDLIYPLPPQDIERVKSNPGTTVVQEPELRIIFFGMDQASDELLYANVKGKNPFKDVRVRKALYKAIDVKLINEKIMNSAAVPAGIMITKGIRGFAPALNDRLPYDPAEAKKLLSEAGYPDGFEVTLDCPNNRYLNDEQVCIAATAMLARVGISVKLSAMPKSKYFGKLLSRDTSFYLLGWSGGVMMDGHNPLLSLVHTPGPGGAGGWNIGKISDLELDALIDSIAAEMDPAKRDGLMRRAFGLVKDKVVYIPLFQPPLLWGKRDNVNMVQTPDEKIHLRWVTVR